MSCVHIEYAPALGVLLDIAIAPPGEEANPADGKVMCKALVDTGATHSCISAEIAARAGIAPDGELLVNSASEVAARVKPYPANLVIPGVNLTVPQITLTEAALPPESEFQALLGRDILCRGSFHLDFSGNAVFCI